MSGRVRPQIGGIVVTPLVTIGVLAALLVWSVEHVGSVALSATLVLAGLLVGIFMARRVRRRIEELSTYYEALLNTADEQSRRAEAANRVKDEFLATLSHELRTPLNSILGWARLLSSGKLDSAQARRAIEAIERAGWGQSKLIEDLLDVSRIVSGKMRLAPRPTRVQAVVESGVQSLQPAADAKRIRIDVAIDSTIETTIADPDRLQQVVWNLLSNAIKFTGTGGRVSVRLARADNDFVLKVADTGIGFEAHVAEHLFERFTQGDSSTTRQYAGLGLGLGIVRHIVELHGGTVRAESAGPNSGASFEVRVPLRPVTEPVRIAAPPERHRPAPVLRGLAVLVVDDDPQALDFVKSTLEEYGATVTTARSAKEASDRFVAARPDVLVSDLMMADRDGIDLIREIRQIEQHGGRHTPAAALTALARSDDRRRALSAGYEMHVTKPVDPGELASTVAHLARRAPAPQLAAAVPERGERRARARES